MLFKPVSYTTLIYFAFALFVVGFFSLMQFVPSAGFADPDGFYHAGMARLMAEGKAAGEFPWAYFSTLREQYGNQHYIYHLLLRPFTSTVGMHVSVVLFSSAMVFGLVWLLHKLGVRYAWAWGLFAMGSSIDFLFRINVVKANTLSLLLLFAAVWLLVKKKYVWLLPLSALFVWVYGGFVFLPAMAGIYLVSFLVPHKKIQVKPMLWVVAGIAIGLIIHPHFPDLATHLYYQLFQSGLGAGLHVPVGNEWNPYGLPELISSNGLAILLFVIASAISVVEFDRLRKENPNQAVAVLFLWLTSVFMLLLSVRSRRFVEYSAPFLVIFSAYSLRHALSENAWVYVKDAWQMLHVKAVTMLMAGIIVIVMLFNATKVWQWLDAATSPETLRGSAQWLASNTNPGQIVFNTKWDDLPQLFYWNSHNYYIIGLDPTFLHVYSPELYWKWRQLADNDPAKFNNSYNELRQILQNDFQTKYIILENGRDSALKAFLDSNSSQGAAQAYSDEFSSVYIID